MPSLRFLLLGPVLLLAAAEPLPAAGGDSPPAERRLTNVVQLTDEGDNGEAYWSWDGKKLIWQSNRGGQACDKIWTMNADGSDKRRVSPDRGAHTCAFFFPGDERTVFSSTSHQEGECPPLWLPLLLLYLLLMSLNLRPLLILLLPLLS